MFYIYRTTNVEALRTSEVPMNSITAVTTFFVILVSVALVVAVGSLGVLAALGVSRHRQIVTTPVAEQAVPARPSRHLRAARRLTHQH